MNTYGYIKSNDDIRNYKLCSTYAQIEFPDVFELDNLPDVKDQTTTNSCVAHTISSILEYHDKNNHRLSTQFIYGTQKKLYNQCMMGMMPIQALSTVKTYGDCEYQDCPGNDEIPKAYEAEKILLDSKKIKNASKYIIDSYYLCSTINDVKAALMTTGPVLFGVNWYEDWQLDKDNVIYFNKNSNYGGHAVMCYGWDMKGWKIQNSWGEKFGDKGRFILPYQYGFIEARAIIDHIDDNNNLLKSILYKPTCKAPKLIVRFINWIMNKIKDFKDDKGV